MVMRMSLVFLLVVMLAGMSFVFLLVIVPVRISLVFPVILMSMLGVGMIRRALTKISVCERRGVFTKQPQEDCSTVDAITQQPLATRHEHSLYRDHGSAHADRDQSSRSLRSQTL
jgi:hypothetical protein